jgi:Tfp pilus assembly protein PilE
MRYEEIPDQTQCKYKGITLMTFIIMIVISSILAVIVVGL